VGLLLLLEAAALGALGAYELSRVDWRGIGPSLPPPGVLEAAAVLLFAPSALLALLSGLSFLLLRRRGWLLAAVSQGLSLAVCLWLYSELRPPYVYPIMAYCVVVILYLNSRTVRTAFRDARAPKRAPKRAPRGEGAP
jgi:hypothetical protein